jgi:hypothetical protein
LKRLKKQKKKQNETIRAARNEKEKTHRGDALGVLDEEAGRVAESSD